METYKTPEFLEHSEVDEIHKRMLDTLPDSWDKSEGNYIYDLTHPTAIELSRLKQFDMNEAIKLIFPMFSTDIYLDYHGQSRNLPRKQAVEAIGKLLVNADKGCIIKKDDLFSTESVNGEEAVLFSATESVTLEESGDAEISIKCTETGTIGNVPSNTIIFKFSKNDKIKSVTNPDPLSGGVNQEEDDDYRDRILEYDKEQGSSYVGNPYDYKRWANEVNGVGEATVISANDDSGLVTIVLTDGTGAPATTELCTSVYNHIMSPDDEDLRLAPVNANLSVIPPQTIPITISATVELIENGDITTAAADLLVSLKLYFQTAIDDNEIRYAKICETIGKISNIYDYKDVLLNAATANIPLESNQLPSITLESITLTEGFI